MLLKRTRFVKGKFENFPDTRLADQKLHELVPGVSVRRAGTVAILSSGSLIRVNNQQFCGEQALTSPTVIEIGEDIFVFEDEDAERAFLEAPATTEEKIERVSVSESAYSPISVKALKQQHYRLFLGDGTALGTLSALTNRLIQYARIKLKWERAVMLRVLGNQGVCLASAGIPQGFRVPTALVFPAFREKRSQRYIREDAESRGLPPSLSIVENHTARAVIVPFVRDDQKIIAILYADSSSCLVPDASYFLLDHVAKMVAAPLAEHLEFPELREVEL